MSYTNGFQTLVQSMNGLLVFNDGAGTVIENGVITTEAINLDNIYATSPSETVSLWNNLTGGTALIMTKLISGSIYWGTLLSSGYIFIGNTATNIQVGMFYFINDSIQKLPGYTSSINLFNDQFTTGTINFANNMTSGTINLGSSLVSMVLGSFTFLGTSIQAGTSGTFNFFTNITGSSTVNLFSNMPSGTFNIGKGGNINIGQATTGSLIKIDQNGLDTQVIISPQQGPTGNVFIGSNSNNNRIGNLNIVNNTINPNTAGQTVNLGTINTTTANFATGATTTTIGGTTCNVGNQNAGVNYQLNLGTNGITTGTNRVNIGVTNTDTVINGGGVTLGLNTTGGFFWPSFLRLGSGGDTIDLFFRGASATLNNTYETLIKSYSGSIWSANAQGLQQTYCGQQEMIYNGSFTPRNLSTFNGSGRSYYSGSGGNGAENATAISGYAPYGGIQFGGCGSSNAKGFSSTWGASMVTYPGYGTRFKNGGISFDNSNLTYSIGNDRGWVPISGVQSLQNLPIGGNGNVQQAISYGRTFSANPFVTATMLMENINSATDALTITIYNVTTTGFNVNIHNNLGGSTGSNRWGYHWIAWAPY